MIEILKEFQIHLMYLSLKFLASILIKILEEFHSHLILWLNSFLIFFLISDEKRQLSILEILIIYYNVQIK